MGDAFGRLVQSILDISAIFVTPDWGALVNMIPIILLVAVVGPIVSLVILGWVVYWLRAPHRRQKHVDPEPIQADFVDGAFVYPAGEPYCPTHALVHPGGATVCAVDRRELLVRCPKCDVVRAAHMAACPQCGLVLRIDRRAVALTAPAAPPPGGAAAA